MSPDAVTEFIRVLREEADGADFRTLSGPAIPATTPGVLARWRTRLATAAAAGVTAVAAFGGLAYAADDAAPGALLYGIDRAFEGIGIGNGGEHERLEEAVALAKHGDPALGLEHAAGVTGDPAAQAALIEAAERIMVREQNQVGEQTQTRVQVAELLQYMAQNAGAVDGPTVADLARSIGGEPSGPPDGTPAGPPDGVPAGPPDSTPGGPGDTAPGASGDTPAGSNGGQGAGGDPPQGSGANPHGGPR
ncbi:MAG: hypothetical protein HZA58_10500 [Acidimicrobiia bacterium]|nr:hypothetical protein [Acidimicrobiia bacterium]